jgi:hypothetical protein
MQLEVMPLQIKVIQVVIEQVFTVLLFLEAVAVVPEQQVLRVEVQEVTEETASLLLLLAPL